MSDPQEKRSSQGRSGSGGGRGGTHRAGSPEPVWELGWDHGRWALAPSDDPPARGVAYAELPLRGIAFFIDILLVQLSATMILQVSAFVAGLTVLNTLPGGVRDQAIQSSLGFGVPTLVVGLLQALVFVYLWRVYRSSPGQLALGLFTVRARDGAPLSKRRALVRWLLLFLPAFIVAASSNVGIWYAYGIGKVSDQTGATGLAVSLPVVWYTIVFLSIVLSRRGRSLIDRAAGSVVLRRTDDDS
ncbi:MAG: hypothetical protein QOH61_1305 [Chloroflexota bacterium]|jgi:hypothetical protein|nr:hypothetical protein [Chloroflexota bacterium]